ncbi:cellulose synthase [Rhizobium sp. 0TCS1.26]|uniref:cellulose synthase n=1 Tax=Rhizobium sp. 0TCS1.26 TaxID=3142623 RepID=UPI003D2C95D1
MLLASGTALAAGPNERLAPSPMKYIRVAAAEPDSNTQRLVEQIRELQKPASSVPPEVLDAEELVQASPAAPSTGDAASGTAPAGASPQVDESALRYFATRGDTARLQAEIARLRALYPNWQPPADPLAVPPLRDAQLENMWRLYAEGRYAEVRRAVAERQSAEQAWQPPADLLERLDVAEARVRLINASNLKQYDTVVNVGAGTPSLLSCAEVDVLWRVAEAFIRTNRTARGQDAYSFILKTCENPQERQATIQRAASLLSYAEVQPLLALEQTSADGVKEFDPIRDDLARAFVAEANRRPEIVLDPIYIERLQRLAQADTTGSDSMLLGWYQLRHDNMAEAEKWFRASREKTNTASASQGLALTLIARNASSEAEEVMFRWKDESEDSNSTYLAATANLLAGDPPPTIQAPVLQRVAAEVTKKRYVPTAQQFGWYARAYDQPEAAIRWFQTALSWKADDEPSAYGLALTQQQLNNRAAVDDLRRSWSGKSERIANLGLAVGNQPPVNPGQLAYVPQQTAQVAPPPRPVAQPVARPVAETVRQPAAQTAAPRRSMAAPRQAAPATTTRNRTAGCALGQSPSSSPEQSVAHGWCLMDLNRPLEASQAFELGSRSSVQRVREDAAYGLSLAYLRLGLTNQAAIAATQSPQNPERSAELQTVILADRAVSAFNAKRYRETLVYLDQRAKLLDEPADLAVLRGYSYMSLSMYNDAWKVFEFAAETGNKDASRGLAEIRDMLNGYR